MLFPSTLLVSTLLANAINPFAVLVLIAAPFLGGRQADLWGDVRAFWARCVLGIGLGVILAESGKWWEVWLGHPTFPSGHETFCLAAMTCLAARDWRWLALGLPLAGLMAWALVTAHFHRPVDVAGALLTGPPIAFLCQRWHVRLRRRRL